MAQTPLSLDFQPGIQRDGTVFDANRCIDSLWCRWRLGKPRKIGGYQDITSALNSTGRRVHCFYSGTQIITHVGHSKGIQQVIFDLNGNFLSIADRTPIGFAGGLDVGWTLDALFDTTSSNVVLVAHSVPNIDIVAGTVQTVPFLGRIDLQAPLAEFSNPGPPGPGVYVQPNLAGGVFCVQPYVCGFDINGFFNWSAPNLPNYLGVTGGSSGAGSARVSAQKLIAGISLRGGGAQSPAGLLWSLSEVIGFTFIGGAPVWAFNTISPSSSILAGATVVEYDSLYFWVGQDRFLVYNGVVNELPNPQNQDWFFDNLNRDYGGRSFGMKMPRYGEIWWCAPLYGATEPSHAIIYNVRENMWYDTELPDGGRGAGYFAQGFRYPIMTGTAQDASPTGCKLWMHDVGVDKNDAGAISAIRSYYETPWVGGPKDSPASNKSISSKAFEPDLTPQGEMTIEIIGAYNNRSAEVPIATITLPQVPANPQEQFVSFKTTNRLTRFHIESNVVGGNYLTGRNLFHADQGDERLVG